MQRAMIRSARSISPPLASRPSDSALARWYEITELSAMTPNGSIARCGDSCERGTTRHRRTTARR